MDVFLVSLVLFIVFLKIENNNRIFLSFGFISALVLIFFIYYAKTNFLTEFSAVLSLFLQAYFPGVYNLANVFSLETDISKLSSLFSDFYTMIPFRNSVFASRSGMDDSISMIALILICLCFPEPSVLTTHDEAVW